ncbi:hypothetical protein [Flindersiella endophytica]
MSNSTRGGRFLLHEEEAEQWLGQWRQHIGLLIGFASLIFIGSRIMAVSAFRSDTAWGVLQASGAGNVAVGTVVPVIPGMTLAIAILILIRIYVRVKDRGWATISQIFGLTFFGSVGIISAQIVQLLTLILTAIIAYLFSSPWKRWKKSGNLFGPTPEEDAARRMRMDYLRRRAAGVAGIVLAMTAIDARPWVPPEQLVLTNGLQSTNYVLSETNGTLVTLTEYPRRIARFEAKKVRKRGVCDVAYTRYYWLTSTLTTLTADHSRAYPACPGQEAPWWYPALL